MKTVTILKRARKLLSNPKRWCQWRYGQTKEGWLVDPEAKAAYSFCAVGAIRRVAKDAADDDATEAAKALLDRCVPGYSIIDYNDAKKRKHEQVLAVFDKAIARAEKAALAAKTKGAAK